MTAIKAGDTIAVDYTGKLEDGNVFDTSQGKDPMKFTVGSGMLIKGFDQAVLGMEKGESKTVTIPPEEAYGNRDENAFVDFPASQVPEEMELSQGMQLQLQDDKGRPVPATVVEITEESVKMDVNHFLAGKTLTFDITISETGLEPDAHQCGHGSPDCGAGESCCGSDPQQGGGCGCGC
ncbi:MAG: peptidylprolyl isomerase [Desulfobacteraceae bacterium]